MESSPASNPSPTTNLEALESAAGGHAQAVELVEFAERPGVLSDDRLAQVKRQLTGDNAHERQVAVRMLRDMKKRADARQPAVAAPAQAAAPLAVGGAQPFASKTEFYAAQAEARKTHGHWKNDPNFNARLKVTPGNIIRI